MARKYGSTISEAGFPFTLTGHRPSDASANDIFASNDNRLPHSSERLSSKRNARPFRAAVLRGGRCEGCVTWAAGECRADSTGEGGVRPGLLRAASRLGMPARPDVPGCRSILLACRAVPTSSNVAFVVRPSRQLRRIVSPALPAPVALGGLPVPPVVLAPAWRAWLGLALDCVVLPSAPLPSRRQTAFTWCKLAASTRHDVKMILAVSGGKIL